MASKKPTPPSPAPAAPRPSAAQQLKSDSRQTSLEAGRALQRLLDAAPGAQIAHATDVGTLNEAKRVLALASTLHVNVPSGEISAASIADRIDDLRRQLAVQRPVAHDATVRMGDEVLMDLLGYLGGEPFVAHTDTWYNIAPNALLPGLFEALTDVTIPNQRVVHVHLPSNYPVVAHAGRTAVFAVYLKEARRRELPDLDDPFVLPLLNRGVKTPDQLREQVRGELVKERALQMVEHAKMLLLRELYVRCMDDVVPTELVDEEVTRRWRGFVGEALIRQGVSLEEQQRSRHNYGSDKNLCAEARRTVWEARVCEAVAAHLGVQVNDAELKKSLTAIFGVDVDLESVLYKNPQLHKDLVKGLRVRRAVDALIGKATVSFDAAPTSPDKAYVPLAPPSDKSDRMVVTAARGLARPQPKPPR